VKRRPFIALVTNIGHKWITVLKIDEIDAKILRLLIKDARTKKTEIADACGLSSTAINNRIESMKANGLIVKSALNINLAFFGYPYLLLIGVNLLPEKENQIIDVIKQHTKVAGIDRTVGKYDLCLFVFAENLNDLDRLKNLIKNQHGVTEIDVNIWSQFQLNYDNLDIRR
jgi:DNA-binding Lrp family transcriptional regulator